MKATPEQMEQIGEILMRCDLARMDALLSGNETQSEAVLAGFVTALCILLPKKQWNHILLVAELDAERIHALVDLVPKAPTETSEPQPPSVTVEA